MFFIHIESRRVYLAGVTTHPDNACMKQQARNVCMVWDKEKEKVKPQMLIRDFDGKYTKDYDAILESQGTSGQGE